MTIVAICAECGQPMFGHECWDYEQDDDRAYSNEDDDRVPPAEEGEDG